MSTKILRNVALLATAVLLVWGLGGSVRHVGGGEALLDRKGAHKGPAWVTRAPWVGSGVFPLSDRVEMEAKASLPEGASWNIRASIEVRLEPEKLDRKGREILIAAGHLREFLAPAVSSAASEALRVTGAQAFLERPASLGPPLQSSLRRMLPPGVRVETVAVALVAGTEATRAAGVAAARARFRQPVVRVLYVGIDGADWDIVMPMIRRGELPTFARLVREGVSADLNSFEPMMSPLLWTTALTGRPPDEHGVCDFTLRGADEAMVPIDSRSRRVASLWEILGVAGQPSAFAGFWATHPAEKFDGVMVSDLVSSLLAEPGPRHVLPAGAVFPEGALDALQPRFVSTESVSDGTVRAFAPALDAEGVRAGRAYWADPELRSLWRRDHPAGPRRPPEAFLVKMAAEVSNLVEIGLEFLRRPEHAVVGVYFQMLDEIGHNFQHLAPPPHRLAEQEQARRFGSVVEASYQVQDAALARLVKAAENNVAIVVHSDHGFCWGMKRPLDVFPFTQGQPVEWHRHHGIFLAAGFPFRRGVRVPAVSLFELAPAILALRGLPAASDMRGPLRVDWFQEEVVSRLPQDRIATWDALVPPRIYDAASSEDLDEAQERLLENLRGLGYIGDVGGTSPRPLRNEPPSRTEEGVQARPGVTYWRNLATFFLNENRFDAAEEALVRADREDPLPKTRWLLSEARAGRGDVAGAIRALEDGFRDFPKEMPPEAIVWMIELMLRAGEIGRAESTVAAHRDALRAAPAMEHLAVGRIAEAQGRRADALSLYLAALAADPRTVRAAERFAALVNSREERSRLLPVIRKALDLDPRIEVYWKMLALLRAEAGDVAGAASSFLRAAELEPDNEKAQVDAAVWAERAGSTEVAQKLYEGLALRRTKIASVWLSLGSLRADSGDRSGAEAAWRQALQLGADPGLVRQQQRRAR